jgi:hypothetical protein
MKKFERMPNESDKEYMGRVWRYTTDKIIEDIEQIAALPEEQIKSILRQLEPEALEMVEEDCQKLEKYEVCRIASDLLKEKKTS